MDSDATESADSIGDGLSHLLTLLLAISIQLLNNGIKIGDLDLELE